MDLDTTLDALDLESSRFVVAATNAASSFESPVPHCPGWDIAELIGHVGYLYSRVAFVVIRKQIEAPDRSQLPPAPEGQARIGWLAEQRTSMLSALGSAADDTPVWNWTVNSPGPTSFWYRRMAHETLIHRVDIELAQNLEPVEADPELAADTVDEYFELFYPRLATQLGENGLGGSLHLHATDVSDAEWTLDPRREGSPVTREHAKADLALRGSAFDLACWAWGRLPTDRLETFGDRLIADRFQETIRG